ncbi:hypothetical protein Tco_0464650 [Tanacetum coccineum]
MASSLVYTSIPPQVFEIGKCSDKMYLKHHEKQVEDILNYLDELYLHHIEKMEEGRINGNELKTELKEIHIQIVKLQKKRLGQKDKIAFAHYRISNLERIIEKIQAHRMPLNDVNIRNTSHNLDAYPATDYDLLPAAMEAQTAPYNARTNNLTGTLCNKNGNNKRVLSSVNHSTLWVRKDRRPLFTGLNELNQYSHEADVLRKRIKSNNFYWYLTLTCHVLVKCHMPSPYGS